MGRLVVVLLGGVLASIVLAPTAAAVEPIAGAAAVCADYNNQAEAQRAKDTRDSDGDGIYCEHLPCPCSRPGASPRPSPRPAPRPRRRPNSPQNRRQTIKSRITQVIDGDTVRVRPLENTRRKSYLVRMIGIDTPETRKPGTPVECGGKEATDSMFELGFTAPRDSDGDGLYDRRGGRGHLVKLITDPTQGLFDSRGRLLAYVQRTGRTLQGIQLKRGWAKVYVFRKRFKLLSAFRRIQRGARAADRGVFGMCGGRFHRQA